VGQYQVPCRPFAHLRIRDFQPMLDRIACSVKRALQADSVVRVARTFFPQPCARPPRLSILQRQRGCDTNFPCCPPTSDASYTPDPVRAMLELLRAALRASTGPSTSCAPLGISSSGA